MINPPAPPSPKTTSNQKNVLICSNFDPENPRQARWFRRFTHALSLAGARITFICREDQRELLSSGERYKDVAEIKTFHLPSGASLGTMEIDRLHAHAALNLQSHAFFDLLITQGHTITREVVHAGTWRKGVWSILTDDVLADFYADSTDDSGLQDILLRTDKSILMSAEARSLLEVQYPSATGRTIELPRFPLTDRSFSQGQSEAGIPIWIDRDMLTTSSLLLIIELLEHIKASTIPWKLHMHGSTQWSNQLKTTEDIQLWRKFSNDPSVTHVCEDDFEMLANDRIEQYAYIPPPDAHAKTSTTRQRLIDYIDLGVFPLSEDSLVLREILGQAHPTLSSNGSMSEIDEIRMTHRIARDVWDENVKSLHANNGSYDFTEKVRSALVRGLADYTEVPRLNGKLRVLIVGADFKFAGDLLTFLAQRDDIELRVDRWEKLYRPQPEVSDRLLPWADVIICEFTGVTAAWYSQRKLDRQKLILRLHGYELNGQWIPDIAIEAVSAVVFATDFYRKTAIQRTGWPEDVTKVIPNTIDTMDLLRTKSSGSMYRLGLLGYCPILKRPDRALDLLELLLVDDDRYHLHLHGRNPWNYPWIWASGVNRDAYLAFYERIGKSTLLQEHCVFEPFSPDIGNWLTGIGWVLSPSYRETFHLAPVEGMASGSIPVVWEREGASEVFDSRWVHASTEDAAAYILSVNQSKEKYATESENALDHASRYDVELLRATWLKLIMG